MAISSVVTVSATEAVTEDTTLTAATSGTAESNAETQLVEADTLCVTDPETEIETSTQPVTEPATDPLTEPETETTDPAEPILPEANVSFSSRFTLGVGEKCTINLPAGTKAVSWSIDNENVVEINESNSDNAKITTISTGTTLITVKLSNGATKTSRLTVKPAPSSVHLSKGDFKLGVGEEFIVSESTNSGTYGLGFEWKSSDESVATVEKTVANKARIVVKAVGETVISITMYNGVTASITLTVKEAPKSVNLSTGNFKLGVGENFTISENTNTGSYGLSFTWSSSNTSVATIKKTIANKAQITAKKTGTTYITVKMYNGVSKTCKLEVKKAPTSIKVSKSTLDLKPEKEYIISENTNAGSYAKGFTWSSSNTSVATVTKTSGNKAKITATGLGTATITVKTYNGKTAKCTVTVTIVNYNINHTSQMVNDEIELLAKMYPDVIKTSVIGQSLKGKDITLVKLGNGNKKGLIFAGSHSREDLAVNFALRSISDYAAAYYSKSGMYGSYNIKDLLNKYTLYVVPCINPDGLDICNGGEYPTFLFPALSRGSYKGNGRNVNINRNFPYGWNDALNGGIYGISNKGTKPGSEPETQAIMNLCKKEKFEWGIDVHILSGGIYWRANHTGVIPNDYNFGKKVSNASGLPLFYAGYDEANYGGVFETWFRDEFNKPALCVELVPWSKALSFSDYRIHARNFDYCSEWSKTKYLFAGAMS